MFGPWAPVAMEALTVAGACAVLLLDLATPAARKDRVGAVSVAVGFVLFLAAWFGLSGEAAPTTLLSGATFSGGLVSDGMSVFLERVFATGGLLGLLVVRRYEARITRGIGEFHFLFLCALAGMFLVSGLADFMSLFVCLEVVTLSFFLMAAFKRDDPRSIEAGLKLLVLGSLSAAFVLFGTAFVYGATGSLSFADLGAHLQALHGRAPSRELLLGLLLVFVGLGFKIGMVPLQAWVPDVYQGAPTPVTAFLSVGSKAAGFALVLRLAAVTVTPSTKPAYALLFGALAFCTLFYGNLAAIPQVNLKRLMGYSSIGHCGYLLLGLAALGPESVKDSAADIAARAADGSAAVLFYLLAYALTNMAAFLVMVVFSNATGSSEIEDYAGLSRRSPLLAACLTVALLSLAGVPPLAGFFGKFMLLRAVAFNGTVGVGLLIAAGLNVVIGLYFYLCVIKRIYMHEPTDDAPIPVPAGTRALLLGLVAAMVALGIYPGPVVAMATAAAKVAFGA